MKECLTGLDIDTLCINTIRTLSIDAIQQANSGHPGAPMGLAPAAYVLWTRFLKHNPQNPDWHDRDRFVLSGGHASMLLYSLLYLTGYGLTLDDIKNYLNSLQYFPSCRKCTPLMEFPKVKGGIQPDNRMENLVKNAIDFLHKQIKA